MEKRHRLSIPNAKKQHSLPTTSTRPILEGNAKHTISIEKDGDEIEFDIIGEWLTASSIRNYFDISATDNLNLTFVKNGKRKGCLMNQDGTMFNIEHEVNKYILGCSKKENSPKAKLRSHYQQEEEIVERLQQYLWFLPRKQLAFGEADDKQNERIDGGCATPISNTAMITYSHGLHQKLAIFSKDESSNRRSIVTVKQAKNLQNVRKMKVVVIDKKYDFIILTLIDDNEGFPFPTILRSPNSYEKFFAFGLSYKTTHGQHITYRCDRFCSNVVDYRGRLVASGSIDAGDSGGPVFSLNGDFIGMMIASTTTSPSLHENYDKCDVEDKIPDASCSPVDTLVLPACFYMQKYEDWKVDEGVFKPRNVKQMD